MAKKLAEDEVSDQAQNILGFEDKKASVQVWTSLPQLIRNKFMSSPQKSIIACTLTLELRIYIIG